MYSTALNPIGILYLVINDIAPEKASSHPEQEIERSLMGYVLRVRFAAFFAGAAVASFAGLYVLHKDYEVWRHSISQQMNEMFGSLDERTTALEKLEGIQASKHTEAAD
ncbi:hypothetical protein U1Q18_004827 [Sarracenia purpurea var. burkii]